MISLHLMINIPISPDLKGCMQLLANLIHNCRGRGLFALLIVGIAAAAAAAVKGRTCQGQRTCTAIDA
jgi:hypothetical protein